MEEALDVLQTKMLVEDRVVPNAYIFNLLISEFARQGLIKETFKLYNQVTIILSKLQNK